VSADIMLSELWAESVRSIEAKNAEIRELHRANRRLSDALVIAEGQRDQAKMRVESLLVINGDAALTAALSEAP
jgi:hypothetical protein